MSSLVGRRHQMWRSSWKTEMIMNQSSLSVSSPLTSWRRRRKTPKSSLLRYIHTEQFVTVKLSLHWLSFVNRCVIARLLTIILCDLRLSNITFITNYHLYVKISPLYQNSPLSHNQSINRLLRRSSKNKQYTVISLLCQNITTISKYHHYIQYMKISWLRAACSLLVLTCSLPQIFAVNFLDSLWLSVGQLSLNGLVMTTSYSHDTKTKSVCVNILITDETS